MSVFADGAFVGGTVRVQVPATSANLGPGFDALGLALTRYDDVVARVVPDGLHLDVTGHGCDTVTRDESHLVVRAARATFDRLGARPTGLAITCTNRIPHGRGLGSSAAAILAGVLLARALVRDGAALLPDPQLLVLASELEGHPDNVAPCLLGGLTVAWTDAMGAHAVRRDCAPDLVPVALIPPTSASTAQARRLLPAQVSHADAAAAAGRAALLVATLTATAIDPLALLAGTSDTLHQRYRAAAMPSSLALVEELRADGYAAVVSGAGPSVLVLARGQVEAEIVRARVPQGWDAPDISVAARGALVRADDSVRREQL